jgi:hypothetical protein
MPWGEESPSSSTHIEMTTRPYTEPTGRDEKHNSVIQQNEEDQRLNVIDDADQLQTKDEQGGPEYPGTVKVILIVASLLITVFLVALDQTIIGTAIPKITDQFHSVGDVGWYGSAYFLTSTALQPTYGRIYKILNVSLFPCYLSSSISNERYIRSNGSFSWLFSYLRLVLLYVVSLRIAPL